MMMAVVDLVASPEMISKKGPLAPVGGQGPSVGILRGLKILLPSPTFISTEKP